MKKKLAAIIITAILAATAIFALVSCGPKNDEHVLNIVCLNKGYGREWIDELVVKFKADHPGYDVNLEATSSAKTLINSHINSRNNIDDLYISVGSEWMSYARLGKLAELDDIMDDTVDGKKLKDKVNVEYRNSIYYPDRNGDLHTYRLPWISATGGIFYNAKMFEDNGWDVPTTYDELLSLCQTIADAQIPVASGSGTVQQRETVKPFVYTSENPDYFDYTVYTWWAQLAGEQAVKEFTQYASESNYSQSNATYAKLKDATQLWLNIFGEKSYVCSGNSNNDAQQKFARGEAAMMFNGDWMYNEISNYNLSNANFKLAIMKTPKAPNATDSDMLYTIGEDQYIAIPESSIKKGLAKDFIKLMVSDYGCKMFLNKAKGVLAYECDYTENDFGSDTFLKNLIETRNSYETKFTEYPSMQGEVVNSTKMLYLAGNVNIWGTSAYRPYANLLTSATYTIDTAFTNIQNEVARQWPTWKSNLGLK